MLMGSVIICSSVLSLLVKIQGEVCYFLREDKQVVSMNKLENLIRSPSKAMTEVESNRSSSPTSQNLELHFPIGTDNGLDIETLQI